MGDRLNVRPLSKWALLANRLMIPIMRQVIGAKDESPQETHRWTNHHLEERGIEFLSSYLMVRVERPRPKSRGILGRIFERIVRIVSHLPLVAGAMCHMTVAGGMKEYVVVRPTETDRKWYIGWICGDPEKPGKIGISRLVLEGHEGVRVLVGPGLVYFFGVDTETGEQRKVEQTGGGFIGDHGPGRKIRLF